MTDNNAQTPPSSNSDKPDKPDKQAKTGKALTRSDTAAGAGRGSNIVLIIVSLLVLAAAAVGSYALYMVRQVQEQQLASIEQQTQLSETLAELTTSQQQMRESISRLREAQEATSAALQRFAERERMDNLDWAMAEIEYLAIVAMQRLNLGHDPDTALAALEAAARRLKDLDNPSLIPVRKQLTSDINALRAVPEVDISGMALYLADLMTRAEELPLASDAIRGQPDQTGQPQDEPVSGWRGVLHSIWAELRQLVVIQREDEPPAELLAPDERYFLYQNLRLELASARQAVLRRDTRNLQASVELVQNWLERYFNTDAAAVANIQEALTEMATVDLQPELPDISSSLESVRAWQRRQADEKNDEPAE